MYTFQNNGLSDFWMRYGIGNAQRFIPIHVLYGSLGHTYNSVILKAQIITDCDVTSKFGTKDRALKACSEDNLQSFGEK